MEDEEEEAEKEEDFIILMEACFCSAGFGLGTEPVELLLDSSGNEKKIRRFLSVLKLAFLLDPQKYDLETGLASGLEHNPGMTGSFFAFSGLGGGGSGILLGVIAERLSAPWKMGSIIPSAKSSSAKDWEDSNSRRLPSNLNSKSEPESQVMGRCAESLPGSQETGVLGYGHTSEHIVLADLFVG